MDLLNSLLNKLHAPAWVHTLIDHNRFTFLFAIVAPLTLLWTGPGCDYMNKVDSPFSHQKVTETQLDSEVQAWQISVKSRQDAIAMEIEQRKGDVGAAYDELARKREMVTTILSTIGQTAGPVAGPWGGLLTTALGLVTVGLGLDNRRKDRKISVLGSDGPPPTTPGEAVETTTIFNSPAIPPKV